MGNTCCKKQEDEVKPKPQATAAKSEQQKQPAVPQSTSNKSVTDSQPGAQKPAAATKQQQYEEKKASEEAIHQETDRIYKEMMEEVDKHAKARGECFDKSKEAFANGDKALAKQLSDQGKAEGALMEEAREKGHERIFAYRNSHLKPSEIDLHGLQLEFAMKKAEQFVDNAKAKGISPILIITGAGNHSAKDKGPLIKPEVQKMVKSKGYAFEEVNNGSISVTLK